MTRSTYRELPPPPQLANHVACLWYQTVGREPLLHRVVPDACADVIAVNDAPPFVVGPARVAVLVPLSAVTVIVGARFRPGAAPSLLGVPANSLLDEEAPLADLWGSAATPVADALAGSSHVDAKLAVLAHHLTERLSSAEDVDALVRVAVTRLARHPEGHVHELAAALGVGERQLQRRFHAAVGYGPKFLHRVLRFQRWLSRAAVPGASGSRPSLASLAADAGFLDQAHLGREVRDLAGTTPRELLRANHAPSAMSDFFNTVDASTA